MGEWVFLQRFKSRWVFLNFSLRLYFLLISLMKTPGDTSECKLILYNHFSKYPIIEDEHHFHWAALE